MKTKTLLSLIFSLIIINSYSQTTNLEFTFTAVKDTTYIQLDSVKVMNRTQGDESMIYWPDTSITIEITPGDRLLYIGYATILPVVGIQDMNAAHEQFQVSQNYPNPVINHSTISIFIPDRGNIKLMFHDIQGNTLFTDDFQMQKGWHEFKYTPGGGKITFFTASWNGKNEGIKIINAHPHPGKKMDIQYIGPGRKVSFEKETTLSDNPFVKESGILDYPESNEIYTFQFTDGGACPGTPTVTYGGQIYNTTQIFSQCWMKENLNIGTMINGDIFMSDNGIVEKYCYNNELDSCDKYGGLYLWDEMMQYSIIAGSQGICPLGWHIPDDEEWKLLEGAVDSQYGIGDPEWDESSKRGYDVDVTLKSTSGWYANYNGSDLFGFTALPAGNSVFNSSFIGITKRTLWWTSTEYTIYDSWMRSFRFGVFGSFRQYTDRYELGQSVRCLKDD